MKATVQWEDCPRKDGGEHAWSLIQTPPKGTLEVVCISHKVVGAYVHFWNNRTLGCTGEGCEPCEKNRAKFWEGYVAALKARSFDRVIVRITEKIGGQIATWRADRHTLRGAMMTFDRPSRTPNGRIRLQIQSEAANLPDKIVAPDMHEVLCHIWRMHDNPQMRREDPQTIIADLRVDRRA
jgi:hypothetical protein